MGDLLTAYNGTAITYDEIGNRLTDGTWTYTWEHGRELASMTDGTTTWSYTYDANGLRTQRTNGTTTYTYIYNGSQLVQMQVDSDTLYFTYDPLTGTPVTVEHNGTVYYYITNQQGDVIGITEDWGTFEEHYYYDAWGNPVGTASTVTIVQLNPLLYRGYVYDWETGLYYLQSRYYDPEIGRFINADAYAATGQGLTGNNMFAYCGNNPTTNVDYSGTRYCEATSIRGESASDRRVSCSWQKTVVLQRTNPAPIGTYSKGNIYVVNDISSIKALFPGDVVVKDCRGPRQDDYVEIQYSFLIRDNKTQQEILTMLYQYEMANPTGWNRTVESMMLEWDVHNVGTLIGSYVPFLSALFNRSKHTAFDNNSEGWNWLDHIIDGGRKLFT